MLIIKTMGTYSSYRLYQKYQIIGNQDPIPVIPLTYSVSGDSLDPQPLVINLEDDPKCGYVPPVEYQYRDIESGYTCVDFDKYTKIIRQRSSDGIHWENVSYSAGTLIEHNSTDCGYVGELYRWVNSGTTCYEGDKYIRIIQQVSYDGINWTNTGQEARGTMIESDSPDCIEYRWVNMDISTDWICDECPDITYRWVVVQGEYECSGTTKMTKEKKQYSIDSGTTWQDVTPPEYRTGSTVIEYDSTDCGYIPPTPYDGKFKATYSDTTTYEVPCNSSTTLSRAEVIGHSTPYSSMTTAEVGDCVTSIDDYAFSGCTSLTSCTIGSGVTSIGYVAFYRCSGLTSINIPDGVTTIGGSAFNRCYSLASINIPSGVTSIYNYTFYQCSGLTSIVIPDGVTSIRTGAFSGCTSLTSCTIGSGVTTIGSSAFSYCYSITSIDIPNSVTSIGDYAFLRCSGLTSVVIPGSVTTIDYSTFKDCNGLTDVTIGSGVTTIDGSAFYGCGSLSSVTIPDTVTTIGWAAFLGCGITNIVIPDSVTSFDGAFTNCGSLSSCTIGSGVTSIGENTFYGCSSLTSIDIPNSVTRIDNQSFSNCTSLTSITVNATTPPTLSTNAFTNTNNCPIYVPANSVNTYKAASGWSTYSSRIQAIP